MLHAVSRRRGRWSTTRLSLSTGSLPNHHVEEALGVVLAGGQGSTRATARPRLEVPNSGSPFMAIGGTNDFGGRVARFEFLRALNPNRCFLAPGPFSNEEPSCYRLEYCVEAEADAPCGCSLDILRDLQKAFDVRRCKPWRCHCRRFATPM